MIELGDMIGNETRRRNETDKESQHGANDRDFIL